MIRTAVYGAALAVAALVSACSLAPVYERPAAPIPGQWPSGSTTPQHDLAWKNYFTQPVLQDLIQRALEHNRDLRVAMLNIELARAQLGLKQADRWPTVNFGASAARSATGTGKFVTVDSAGLLVTAYELDLFGRVSSLSDQAQAQLLATQEARTTAQVSLIASVAHTWLSWLADRELVTLASDTLRTREDSLRLVRLRFEQGAASELDLQLAQGLLQSARVFLAQQQRARSLDENALGLLLGGPLPELVTHPGGDAQTTLALLRLPELGSGLPSDLLTRRPDIRQAEAQLVAAHANIGAARAAFFPRISLTAGAGSTSNALSQLFQGGTWGFTAAPQLLAPLFDAGRNQANLALAQAARDIAVAQYEKSIQNAFREVADALTTRETLATQLDAQISLAESEATRARLTSLRLQAGAAGQLDWLDAQRSALASQQALTSTRLAYLQSQIGLFKALGGGPPASATK